MGNARDIHAKVNKRKRSLSQKQDALKELLHDASPTEYATPIITNPLWAELTDRQLQKQDTWDCYLGAAANILEELPQAETLASLTDIHLQESFFDDWNDLFANLHYDRSGTLHSLLKDISALPANRVEHLLRDHRFHPEGPDLVSRINDALGTQGLHALMHYMIIPSIHALGEETQIPVLATGPGAPIGDAAMAHYDLIDIDGTTSIYEKARSDILQRLTESPLTLVDPALWQQVSSRRSFRADRLTHAFLLFDTLVSQEGSRETVLLRQEQGAWETLQDHRYWLGCALLAEDDHVQRSHWGRSMKAQRQTSEDFQALHDELNAQPFDELSRNKIERLDLNVSGARPLLRITYDDRCINGERVAIAPAINALTLAAIQEGHQVLSPAAAYVRPETGTSSAIVVPLSGCKYFTCFANARKALEDRSISEEEALQLSRFEEDLISCAIDRTARLTAALPRFHPLVGKQRIRVSDDLKRLFREAIECYDVDVGSDVIQRFDEGADAFDTFIEDTFTDKYMMGCRRDPNPRHFIIPIQSREGEDPFHQEYDVLKLASRYSYDRLMEETKEFDFDKVFQEAHRAENPLQILTHPDVQIDKDRELYFVYRYELQHLAARSPHPIKKLDELLSCIDASLDFQRANDVLEQHGIDMQRYLDAYEWLSAARNFKSGVNRLRRDVPGHLHRVDRYLYTLFHPKRSLPTPLYEEFGQLRDELIETRVPDPSLQARLERLYQRIPGDTLAMQLRTSVQGYTDNISDVNLFEQHATRQIERAYKSMEQMIQRVCLLYDSESGKRLQGILDGFYLLYGQNLDRGRLRIIGKERGY